MKKLIAILMLLTLLTGCTVPPEQIENEEPETSETTEIITTAGIFEEKPKLELDKDYKEWIYNTQALLLSDLSYIVSADSSNLAWGTSYMINAYNRAYNATGDARYLAKAAEYIYGIFQLAEDNDGDGYKSWGTSEYNSEKKYEEFAVHVGAFLTPVGEFINLVYSSPSILTKKEPVSGLTYDELCKYLIKEATENMIPSFDCDWNDDIGIYMNRPGSGNYSGSKNKISMPNNQFLALAAALIQFAKVSPEHETEYLRKAEAMLSAFHGKLHYNDKNEITRWNYKDLYFSGDIPASTEDYSHGMFDTRAAIMGYNNGLVFSNEDVKAFAKIYETTMLRGTDAEPLLTQYVDGSGSQNNQLFLHIFDLSPFGEKIWHIGKTTAVYRSHFTGQDVSRILIYHESAPTPLDFNLIGVTGKVFRWEVSVYSCKYTLQISDTEDFTNLLVNRENILDTSVFAEGLPIGKTLYWRVIAGNQSGKFTISNTLEIK